MTGFVPGRTYRDAVGRRWRVKALAYDPGTGRSYMAVSRPWRPWTATVAFQGGPIDEGRAEVMLGDGFTTIYERRHTEKEEKQT